MPTELDIKCIVKIISIVAASFLIFGAFSRIFTSGSIDGFIMSFYIM